VQQKQAINPKVLMAIVAVAALVLVTLAVRAFTGGSSAAAPGASVPNEGPAPNPYADRMQGGQPGSPTAGSPPGPNARP